MSKPEIMNGQSGSKRETEPGQPGVDDVGSLLKQGERVREYVVEGLGEGGAWTKLCEGISIGHKRIQQFEPRKISAVRLRATRSVGIPLIRRLAAYSVG